MSRFEILLTLGMVAVTFPVRYLPMLWVGRIRLSEGVHRALEYVPVAVLTAIISPMVLMPAGHLDLGWDNAYLFASLVSGVLAWKYQHLLLTIAGGLVSFVGWRLLMNVL